MSGRIPPAFIDDLLERVDIVDYINARVPLKKQGKNFSACCPFHDEKTPSFTVSREKQFYYCFGCQAGGNIIGFAMDFQGLAFPEAVEQIAVENGIEVPHEAVEDSQRSGLRNRLYDMLKQADRFYRDALRDSPTAIDYLKGRGISGTTARDFGIGFAPDGWDKLIQKLGKSSEDIVALDKSGMIIKREGKDGYYDRFRNRLMFPIRDLRGRTIAFGGRVFGDEKPKYLNSPETEVFHKTYELYGLYETHRFAPKIERLIMVEGYMDVVSLFQAGIKGSVATLGTAVTPQHLEKVFRHVPEVIFCFDGDQAGRTAADRALHASLPLMIDGRQARFLFLPEGEDPDSLVQKIGAEAFESQLQQAMPLSDYLFRSIDPDADWSTPDARARLHSLTRPLIDKLPKGVFRRLMEKELAQRTGMDMPDPNADKPQAATRVQVPTNPAVAARQRKSLINPIEQLIGIALCHPRVTLDNALPDFALVETSELERTILSRIWRLAGEQPDLQFGSLYARMQGLGEEADRLVSRLAGKSIHRSTSFEQALQEFTDILRHWTQRSEAAALQARLDELKQLPFEDWTDSQKKEQRHLLKRLAELKQARHDQT